MSLIFIPIHIDRGKKGKHFSYPDYSLIQYHSMGADKGVRIIKVAL